MTNPTKSAIYQTRPRAGYQSLIVTNALTLYAGALIGLLSTGYVGNWDDGASSVFLGLNLEEVTGDTSATPPVEARVNSEGVTLKDITVAGTPTQAKVGDPVYSADGSIASITLDATGRNHPIGYMSRYSSATKQEVTLFTPTEMLAQREA